MKDAPAGAMCFSPWEDLFYTPQLEHCVEVKLPDPHGTWWGVDSQAVNCTMKEDFKQKLHHCWVIEGTELPNISISKGGVTCAAGAGSIQVSGWHGWLRNGRLVEC